LEKLFLNNPYIKNFKANILEIQENNKGFSVILDKTAFYPEGGGQPCDTGIIDGCNVSYVYEDEGIIYHVLDRKPRNFTDVDCCIDWDRRFDHMQQHCGQHILSAAFINILNAGTVGFHLGDEFVTIDLSINSISMEDVEKAEETANNIVFSNLPVIFHYPKSDELSQFKLRKLPSVSEDIRMWKLTGLIFRRAAVPIPCKQVMLGL
jgi:alanyl-tRNA synthetase